MFYKGIGICPNCRKRAPEPHKALCLECLEKRRESDERYRKTHRKKRKNTTTERRKQNGICVTCGIRKAVNGKTRCGICLEKQREQAKERRGAYLERYERPTYGMCYICGSKELYENRHLCKRCYDNACKNIAKGRITQQENGISVHSW
jgi:hypothetical protein